MFRLYSEHVPYDAIDAPLLDALGRRGIELALAVFPSDVARLEPVLRRLRASDVRAVLWPLLDDAQGRWPNANNSRAFAMHVDAIAGTAAVGTMLFDVEPPIDWTRAVMNWRYVPRPRRRGSHAELAQSLRARGWTLEAVVPPMLLYGVAWERWLGTPVRDLQCERVEPMLYTSLFEGYSRGLVSRRVARDLLARMTAAADGAVSLGVVGGGALGDERAYRNVDELRDDVALAKAAGATRLSLYALDGIFARGQLERWLDALVLTDAGVLPPRTRRGSIVERVAGWLGAT